MKSNMWKRMIALACAGIMVVSGSGWSTVSVNAADIEEEAPALEAIAVEEAPALAPVVGEEAPAVEENAEETNAETYAEGVVIGKINRDEKTGNGEVTSSLQTSFYENIWNAACSPSGFRKIQISTVEAYSEQPNESGNRECGYIKCIADNDTNTYWHTQYDGGNEKPTEERGYFIDKNNIILTLSSPQSVKGVTYLPRVHSECPNGTVTHFNVYVKSQKDDSWQKVDNTFKTHGRDGYEPNKTNEEEFLFVDVRNNIKYIKIEVKKTTGDHINAAEIGVLSDKKIKENLALGQPVDCKYPDGSNAGASGYPESWIVDGDRDQHSDFGNPTHKQSAYAQVDLGKLKSIDHIEMIRYFKVSNRKYNNTVIGISETSDFRNPTIIYNSDRDNVHGFGNGRESYYPETKFGKVFDVPKGTEGRFVRVYMYGNGTSGSNHIVELEVYGDHIENPRNKEDLYQKHKSIKDIAKGNYTEKSWDAFRKALTNAETVLNTKNATDEAVASAMSQLKSAHTGLEELGDYTAFNEQLALYKAVQPSWYTDVQSYNTFRQILDGYDRDLPDSKQDTIDGFVKDMQAKYRELEKNLKLMSTANTKYNVTLDNVLQNSYAYNKKCELTGNEKYGLSKDGVLLSTDPNYTFYTIGDYDLKKVFATEGNPLEIEAKAIITDVAILDHGTGTKKVRFSAQVTVPKDYGLETAGLEWGLNDNPKLAEPAYIDRCNQVYQFSVTMTGLPDTQTIHGNIVATMQYKGQDPSKQKSITIRSAERKADPSNTERIKKQ